MITIFEKRGQLAIRINYGLNVSTTPITAMGCRQCLPLFVVLGKGKHWQKPHFRNGVVGTFGLDILPPYKHYSLRVFVI